MTLEIFWLLGLIAIGFVFGMFARSVSIRTTRDLGLRKAVVSWGVAIAILWIVYGGIIVALYLANKE